MSTDLISPQESAEIAKACEILRLLPGVVGVDIELEVSSDGTGSVRKRVKVDFAMPGDPESVKVQSFRHVDEFTADSAALEAGLKQAAESARRFGAAETQRMVESSESELLDRMAKLNCTNVVARHLFFAWRLGRISFPDYLMGIIEALDGQNKSLLGEAMKASQRTDAQIWAENKRQLMACIAAGASAPKAATDPINDIIGHVAADGKTDATDAPTFCGHPIKVCEPEEFERNKAEAIAAYDPSKPRGGMF